MINLNIIVRSLLRQKLTTGIITISLAVGMACLNLIAMFIHRELNTDGFHKDKDRIYTIKSDYKGLGENEQVYACGKDAAEYMKNNFSQVEDFCRIQKKDFVWESYPRIVVNNNVYYDRPVTFEASGNFFRFFSYELITNNPETALEAKNSMVISEELAYKYFGSAEAVGKVIDLVSSDNKESMVVTGIFRKPLGNSQLKFDVIRLIPRGQYFSACYVKLKQHADAHKFEEILLANKNKMPGAVEGFTGVYHLKPLCNDYFVYSKYPRPQTYRDKNDLWIAFLIGLIIMSIAIFNYLGLLHNSLIERNKTYTVQRVNGGTKAGFVLHFMIESLLVVGASFFLSLLLMMWLMPFFNELTNSNITALYIFSPKQILILLSIVLFLLFITMVSVNFRIKDNLDLQALKPGNIQLRKQIQCPAFNIFQLASSIILIIISAVILKQTRLITNNPIGIDKSVIEVKIPINGGKGLSEFREELLADASISQVSIAEGTPIENYDFTVLKFNENGVNKEIKIKEIRGDENYISTVGIKIIEGTGYSGNLSVDWYKVLINESAARLFPGKNLIGTILPGRKRTDQVTKKLREIVIAGIVKDFQYSSLKSVIEPAMILYDPTGYNLLVKPQGNQIPQANLAIARLWKKYVPDYPLERETIGDQFEFLHRENKNYLKLISACCFISIFLTMIGLFAISYRSSQYRTKEIGIRKVNGAKILEILITLNKDYLKWIVIAFVIAFPVAWYATHKWLESFAYKTELSWWIFASAGLITLVIVLLTVSWQSWKAATRNPVEALRYE